MRRIVSVWFPHLPIERLRKAEPGAIPAAGADEAPFALVASDARGQRLTAVNRSALAAGLSPGLPLADARARLPSLLSRTAEPARDRALLRHLARWIGRYGPARNCEGADGLWVDITGVAHLFREQRPDISARVRRLQADATVPDEAVLLADLTGRLARLGLTARVGLADTLAAAHALARFAAGASGAAVAAPGTAQAALAALPMQALRLAPDTVLLLRRLGLGRIGDLYGLPRAALERRFRDKTAAASVLTRLDQALGRLAEPQRPLLEPPAFSVRQSFAEPLIAAEAIAVEVQALTGALARRLHDAGQGARRIALALYRTDASAAVIDAGTSEPCRDARHLFALLAMRLDSVDAGFGIDALVLDALGTDPLTPTQTTLAAGAIPGRDRGDTVGQLIDRLTNRLGPTRVHTLAPRASHVPERAAMALPAFAASPVRSPPAQSLASPLAVPPAQSLAQSLAPPLPSSSPARPRPPFLLPRPEPIAVMAEVPEGAPARFTWRRRGYRIVKTEGPERIAPEWWRRLDAPRDGAASGLVAAVRDYYRLEDEAGGRYWVFRAGLYQEPEDDAESAPPPAWYLHGVFA